VDVKSQPDAEPWNLVLSGGGARGFAHLGVIKALREKKVDFSAISATSSGAMVGALLADGYTADEIASIFREALPITRFNFALKRHGLLNINTLTRILDTHLRNKTFEKLRHPLHVSLTNLNSGKQAIINSGEVIPAVVASSSIPILLPPVIINGIPYADGGISGNLPVEPFLKKERKIIGIHVNPLGNYDLNSGTLHQLERFIHLSIRENVLREIEKVDLLIEPPALVRYGLFDTAKIDEIIQIGYHYTKTKVNV
jgi:NTE family protein